MAVLSDSQLRGLVQKYFGDLGPAMVDTMFAVAKAESGGRTDARNLNPATNDDSYGLFQVNRIAWGKDYSPQQLVDPEQNVKAARRIFDAQGLRAWGAYTAGTYKQFAGNGAGPTEPVSGQRMPTLRYNSTQAKPSPSEQKPVESGNPIADQIAAEFIGIHKNLTKGNQRALAADIRKALDAGVPEAAIREATAKAVGEKQSFSKFNAKIVSATKSQQSINKEAEKVRRENDSRVRQGLAPLPQTPGAAPATGAPATSAQTSGGTSVGSEIDTTSPGGDSPYVTDLGEDGKIVYDPRTGESTYVPNKAGEAPRALTETEAYQLQRQKALDERGVFQPVGGVDIYYDPATGEYVDAEGYQVSREQLAEQARQHNTTEARLWEELDLRATQFERNLEFQREQEQGVNNRFAIEQGGIDRRFDANLGFQREQEGGINRRFDVEQGGINRRFDVEQAGIDRRFDVQEGGVNRRFDIEQGGINRRFDVQEDRANREFGATESRLNRQLDLEGELGRGNLQLGRSRLGVEERQGDTRLGIEQQGMDLERAKYVAEILRNPADFLARAYMQRGQTNPNQPVTQEDLIKMAQPRGVPKFGEGTDPDLDKQGFFDAISGKLPRLVDYGRGGNRTASSYMNGYQLAKSILARKGYQYDGKPLNEYGNGTQYLNPDGTTSVRRMIIGDEQYPGVPNPEMVQVVDPGPKTRLRIQPLADEGIPAYANGTYDPLWDLMNQMKVNPGIDQNAASRMGITLANGGVNPTMPVGAAVGGGVQPQQPIGGVAGGGVQPTGMVTNGISWNGTPDAGAMAAANSNQQQVAGSDGMTWNGTPDANARNAAIAVMGGTPDVQRLGPDSPYSRPSDQSLSGTRWVTADLANQLGMAWNDWRMAQERYKEVTGGAGRWNDMGAGFPDDIPVGGQSRLNAGDMSRQYAPPGVRQVLNGQRLSRLNVGFSLPSPTEIARMTPDEQQALFTALAAEQNISRDDFTNALQTRFGRTRTAGRARLSV